MDSKSIICFRMCFANISHGGEGQRRLNHLDAHQLGTENVPLLMNFSYLITMDRKSKSNPGNKRVTPTEGKKKNNSTVFKQLMTLPVTISLSS